MLFLYFVSRGPITVKQCHLVSLTRMCHSLIHPKLDLLDHSSCGSPVDTANESRIHPLKPVHIALGSRKNSERAAVRVKRVGVSHSRDLVVDGLKPRGHRPLPPFIVPSRCLCHGRLPCLSS